MSRLRFLAVPFLAFAVLAGCGGGETGKKSTEQNKSRDQQPAKDADKHKPTHIPE